MTYLPLNPKNPPLIMIMLFIWIAQITVCFVSKYIICYLQRALVKMRRDEG